MEDDESHRKSNEHGDFHRKLDVNWLVLLGKITGNSHDLDGKIRLVSG